MSLRFYSLCNFYLSAIQQGIQSGHALGELVVRYEYGTPHNEASGEFFALQRKVLRNFLMLHKTWVVLNGGTSRDILNFMTFMQENDGKFKYPIPFAEFREDDESLSGMITCVGLILPEPYFNVIVTEPLSPNALAGDFICEAESITERFEYGSPDWELISRVKNCPLAR